MENLTMERALANMSDAYACLENFRKADQLEQELEGIVDSRVEIIQNIEKLQRELYKLNQDRNRFQNRIQNLRNNIPETGDKSTEGETLKFFGHCPWENCRGLITANQRCNVCEKRVCKSCKEPVGDEEDALKLHACNPNTLESIRQIRKDSKPCPQCRAFIFKTEGCNQMFCTNCKIAFCWRTGEIYRGTNIHNPHYFDFLNNGGGACGNNNLRVLHRLLSSQEFRNLSTVRHAKIIMIRQLVYKIMDIEGRVLPELRNVPQLTTTLKVNYLMSKIEPNEFKKELRREALKLEKNVEKINIIESLIAGINIIVNSTVNTTQRTIDEDNFLEQLDKLIKFLNGMSKEFVMKYKTSCYLFRITKDGFFEIIHTNILKSFNEPLPTQTVGYVSQKC